MKCTLVSILAILLCACTQQEKELSLKITKKLFGIPIDLGQMVYQYQSERSPNGDGYSMYVYNIPIKYNDSLKSKIHAITNTHPKKPQYREHWNEKKWSLTPCKKSEQWFIDFSAKNDYLGNTSEELKQATKLFKALISRKGNYYSYFYTVHDFDGRKRVGDIDFFIYSPDIRKLLIINHNT